MQCLSGGDAFAFRHQMRSRHVPPGLCMDLFHLVAAKPWIWRKWAKHLVGGICKQHQGNKSNLLVFDSMNKVWRCFLEELKKNQERVKTHHLHSMEIIVIPLLLPLTRLVAHVCWPVSLLDSEPSWLFPILEHVWCAAGKEGWMVPLSA